MSSVEGQWPDRLQGTPAMVRPGALSSRTQPARLVDSSTNCTKRSEFPRRLAFDFGHDLRERGFKVRIGLEFRAGDHERSPKHDAVGPHFERV